jgi:hypothetical protein
MEYPKFEERLKDKLINPAAMQRERPGYGMVIDHDRAQNTATVLMAQPGSDQPGEYFTNVPCPIIMGVQMVAPEPGRPCWVVFKDGAENAPYISHYFNPSHEKNDFHQQYDVVNEIPRYIMDL